MSGFVFWGTGVQWVAIIAVLWMLGSFPVILAPRRKTPQV